MSDLGYEAESYCRVGVPAEGLQRQGLRDSE
jgi:hypothetical protein